jgi:hypothetical protein
LGTLVTFGLDEMHDAVTKAVDQETCEAFIEQIPNKDADGNSEEYSEEYEYGENVKKVSGPPDHTEGGLR